MQKLDFLLLCRRNNQKGAKVYYSIVAEDAVIEEDAQVGAIPENLEDPSTWGVAVVGSNAKSPRAKG